MEHRKTHRFDLRLPIELVPRERVTASGYGETRNLSSGGVLFNFNARFRIGDPLEFVITLSTPRGSGQFVRLHCLGKVIRVSRNSEVAATIERYDFVRAYKVTELRRTASDHPAVSRNLPSAVLKTR
jgi:hypothetical protein